MMEGQRYPINIRLIGVMHKEKKKMYMASVLWSDQNEIVAYRSLRDFVKMHKQMKKAFPPANPMKKSSRIIPKLKVKKLKMRSTSSKHTKSINRLKILEKYCNDLLSCDPRVTQSPQVIQFFHPKDQDLKSDFAKNSIVIMPSDDPVRSDQRSASVGNVTQPFVTETYRCVAPYETKDTTNRPFKVAVDEKVDVLIKDKAGWWLVESEDKKLAWFPAPFLEKLENDEDFDEVDEVDGEHHGNGVLYTAARSYKATKGDEVSVDIGSVVEVLQKSDNGWWLIRFNGKAGYIPSMYLQPYNNPRVRMATLQNNLLSSSLNLSTLKPSSAGLAGHAHELSRSQSSLLQTSHSRPSSPSPLRSSDKLRSRSMNVLSEPPMAVPVAIPYVPKPAMTPRGGANLAPPPTITVEMDGEEEQRQRSPTTQSEDSLGSDSSDLSFADDFSSSGASSLNLSQTSMDERLRLSRTPPPPASDRLTPFTPGGVTPSVSDPNLSQRPTTPKVPPRPHAQEILTRCSTVTRKNASKGRLSPADSSILSR